MSIRKKSILVAFVFIILLLVISLFVINTDKLAARDPIRVGILHSLTGTMAISERPVVDATLLAIDQINTQGGLLGRKIKPIVVDTRSDPQEAAKLAAELIKHDKVSAIFGCWTSACRKTVKPVIEENNALLVYPVQYEGLESSPNIVYTGAAPNQQIIPAIKWVFDNIGKRFYLIGSDYVFPRTANEIMKEQIESLGGEVIGEDYVLLGEKNLKLVADRIKAAHPDVIINTINGDSNIAFFDALSTAQISAREIPVMSFSVAENELGHMKSTQVAGHYTAWSYFQSVNTPENQKFMQEFKNKYGADRILDDPMEAAYFGVYLWAQAVKDANSTESTQVIRKIKGQSLKAPEGVVYVDPDNQHTWRIVRVGKIRDNGHIDVVWSSERPIQPTPYPNYRSVDEWHHFLHKLYEGWGNKWINDGQQGKDK